MTIATAGIGSAEWFGSPTLEEREEWWSRRFPFRRRVVVQAPDETAPTLHPVDVEIPLAVTLDQGKTRTDFADVEVVHFDGISWHWMARQVTELGDNLHVRFLLWEAIPAGGEAAYYVHYGSPTSTGIGRPTFADNPWPIVIAHDAGRIGYTRPTEHWRNGISEVQGAKATLEFVGVAARIVSTIGPSWAIAEAQVDDGPWEEVDLFSPTTTDQAVFAVTDLAPGPHKLRFRAAGRTNPNALGKSVNLTQMAYVTRLVVLPENEEVDADQWGGGGLGGG